MISLENSRDKALNASYNYVKRNEAKNKEILYFSNSVATENSHTLKRFARLNQTNTGLC